MITGASALIAILRDVPKAPHCMKVTAMKHIAATCP